MSPSPNRVLPVLLGLVLPGLGHFVLGRSRRAVLWTGAWVGSVFLFAGATFIGPKTLLGAFVLSNLAWLAAAVDVALVPPGKERPGVAGLYARG